MQTLRRNLSVLLIGASALAFAVPAHAQLGVSVGDGGGVSADVGGTSIGGGGSDSVNADVDADLGGTSADADVNLGTDDGATASVNANVGGAAEGSVDVDLGGTDVGVDLDLLADEAASAGGSSGGMASVVASMSSGQIARYKTTCADVAGSSQYPMELRELCKLIMQR